MPVEHRPSLKKINRRTFLRAGIVASGVTLAGCGVEIGHVLSPSKARDILVWGKEGFRDGAFLNPRAIGVHDGVVYVIDRTGRVQSFTKDGEFIDLWKTPDAENGTPTAITFSSNGNVVIPDTHYSRILEYATNGELLHTWGSYGTGEDEFIYPTGAACSPGGHYYFSEYGDGAERVHVFDADRRFLRQWGSPGDGRGQFGRAMSIAIGKDESTADSANVYVADTANHRIQRFDLEGNLLRIIGSPGTAPGQLKYPYDVAVAPDGSILVCEYGAHRISRFSADGQFVRSLGTPGRSEGEFNSPRGLAIDEDGMVYVSDTDNHRIQRFSLEALA